MSPSVFIYFTGHLYKSMGIYILFLVFTNTHFYPIMRHMAPHTNTHTHAQRSIQRNSQSSSTINTVVSRSEVEYCTGGIRLIDRGRILAPSCLELSCVTIVTQAVD